MLKTLKQIKPHVRHYRSLLLFGGVLFTILFSLYVLFWMPAVPTSSFFLADYYLAMFRGSTMFMGAMLGVFVTLVLIHIVALLVRVKAERSRKRAISHFLLHTGMLVVAAFLSIHLALGVATLTLTTTYAKVVSTLKSDPEKLGVIYGQEKVAEELKERKDVPHITISPDNVVLDFVRANLKKQYRLGQFTTTTLQAALPKKLFATPTMPDSNLVLFGEILFIREIEAREMQVIGPEIGRLLVTSYFYPRNIKGSPELAVLSRQEYLKFRDDQINDKIKEIDASIAAINGSIAAARSAMTRIIVRYYYGELSIDDAIAQYEGQEARISRLQGEQGQLRKQREFVKQQKDSTPYELGIFIPKEANKIRVVLDTTKEDSLNAFLVTLVHEYLHYGSYVDEDRRLPTFFEEGLTEYFARRIVGEQFGVQAEVGYPVIVRVIQGFTKKVSEEKLADAYFNKDIQMLEDSLNEAYGEKFYEESEFHFTLIPFSSGEDSIKLANDIMSVIGEGDIKESDIVSE